MILYPELELNENLDARSPSSFKTGYDAQSSVEDFSVSRLNIQDSAVGTTQIENLAVTTAKINALSVTTAKIDALAVTTAKINDLAVTTAKIDALAVTDAKINTLSANKLTAGTIDASVITVTNINADNITAGTLTGRVVQTAASGQRVVLDSASNALKFYNSSGVFTANLYGFTGAENAIKTDYGFIAVGTIYTAANFDADGFVACNTLRLDTLTGDPTAGDGSVYYREDGVNNDLRVKVAGTWRSIQLV